MHVMACTVPPSVIYHKHTNDDDLFNAEEGEDEVHQTTHKNRWFCADNGLGKVWKSYRNNHLSQQGKISLLPYVFFTSLRVLVYLCNLLCRKHYNVLKSQRCLSLCLIVITSFRFLICHTGCTIYTVELLDNWYALCEVTYTWLAT